MGKKAGVVLFPLHASGHLVPTMELANQLRHHSSIISVTILLISSSPSAAAARAADFSSLNIDFVELKLPQEQAPEGAQGLLSLFPYMEKLKPVVSEALTSLSSTTHISAFVLDTFCITMADVAAELGIPAYSFQTSGAADLAFKLYCPTLDRMHHQDFEDTEEEILIPGRLPLPPSSLPQLIHSKKHPFYHQSMDAARRYPRLRGVLVNTFRELESEPMKAIEEGLCVPSGRTPPVYPVRPLVALDDPGCGGGCSLDHECIRWLDQQPLSSVVFLCFGSMGTFTEEQVREIARGLELGGRRFLWSLRLRQSEAQQGREACDLKEVLPAGFMERTREQGLVWPMWVPQAAILSHPAVGGFVSHCGWNSTLESF